ncbi:MAG: low affinity iron permease family protein [Chloroflexi bacterium]|nr:low affinity iron permease family protein [Chloroflexota bacterium]
MNELFRRFSSKTSALVGSSWAFIGAVTVIVAWVVTGPIFHYSDTWQLIINTGTTIVTFLMVFLIQNTQNRDAKAIHLKLDELIRCVQGARTGLIDLEDLSDEELKHLQGEFQRLRERLEGPSPAPETEAVEQELSERTLKPSERRSRHAT